MLNVTKIKVMNLVPAIFLPIFAVPVYVNLVQRDAIFADGVPHQRRKKSFSPAEPVFRTL